MSMTNREKQEALRIRRAEAGLKELRGIWVTADEESTIKPLIRGMLNRIRTAGLFSFDSKLN